MATATAIRPEVIEFAVMLQRAKTFAERKGISSLAYHELSQVIYRMEESTGLDIPAFRDVADEMEGLAPLSDSTDRRTFAISVMNMDYVQFDVPAVATDEQIATRARALAAKNAHIKMSEIMPDGRRTVAKTVHPATSP